MAIGIIGCLFSNPSFNLILDDKLAKCASQGFDMAANFRDDIKQDIYEDLINYSKKDIRARNKRGELHFLAFKILWNKIHQKKNDAHKMYKPETRAKEISNFIIQEEQDFQTTLTVSQNQYLDTPQPVSAFFSTKMKYLPQIKEIINNDLHWYDRDLLLEYIASPDISYGVLAKKYHIKNGSINHTITKCCRIIRKKLKEKYGFDL